MLEHGEIVERGTHDELLALGGRYRKLYDKQYRFETDRFINPGEDFTPEPESRSPPPRISPTMLSSEPPVPFGSIEQPAPQDVLVVDLAEGRRRC